MDFLLTFVNCIPMSLLFERFSANFVHYEESLTSCFVVNIGDGSWIVRDGILQHSDAPVAGKQPMLEPSRYSSPLLNLSMMKWQFSKTWNC